MTKKLMRRGNIKASAIHNNKIAVLIVMVGIIFTIILRTACLSLPCCTIFFSCLPSFPPCLSSSYMLFPPSRNVLSVHPPFVSLIFLAISTLLSLPFYSCKCRIIPLGIALVVMVMMCFINIDESSIKYIFVMK